MIVFICMLLLRRAIQLSINSYLGYSFDPIPLMKGIVIQEDSLCAMPYTLGIPSWGTFSLAILT